MKNKTTCQYCGKPAIILRDKLCEVCIANFEKQEKENADCEKLVKGLHSYFVGGER